MIPLPTLLTVTLIGVAVGLVIILYQLLVLPVQSLGIFLLALGLGVAVLAKRFGRLLCIQRGTFTFTRSPLVLSVLLMTTGLGILLFGPLALLVLGLFALWRVNARLARVGTWSFDKVFPKLSNRRDLEIRR